MITKLYLRQPKVTNNTLLRMKLDNIYVTCMVLALEPHILVKILEGVPDFVLEIGIFAGHCNTKE